MYNTFIKTKAEDPEEESQNLMPRADDIPEVIATKKWLASMFKKDKNPEPLYVLDLILKNG